MHDWGAPLQCQKKASYSDNSCVFFSIRDRASGWVETRQYWVCILISHSSQKWHFQLNAFPWQQTRIIWSQGKWHWQRPRRPKHARTCKQKGRSHAGVPSASLEVMSGWFGALEVCSRVVLKNSEQMASAAQRQKMPIICWNPFILLLYLQTDWEQCHLVQMNEPVSPLMFLSAEGPFRMGRSGNPLFFWFIGGSENMTWYWSWQRGREKDIQRRALLVLLYIYILAAVANRSQLKRCIDVRIGLLADTSVLIGSSTSPGQSSLVRRRAWNFVPFLVVEMMLMFDKLLKSQTLHVLQTRRQRVQVVCIHIKLQLRCSCIQMFKGCSLIIVTFLLLGYYESLPCMHDPGCDSWVD